MRGWRRRRRLCDAVATVFLQAPLVDLNWRRFLFTVRELRKPLKSQQIRAIIRLQTLKRRDGASASATQHKLTTVIHCMYIELPYQVSFRVICSDSQNINKNTTLNRVKQRFRSKFEEPKSSHFSTTVNAENIAQLERYSRSDIASVWSSTRTSTEPFYSGRSHAFRYVLHKGGCEDSCKCQLTFQD